MEILELKQGDELWVSNNLLIERMNNGFTAYKYVGRNRSICLSIRVICFDGDLNKALAKAKKNLASFYDKDFHNEHGGYISPITTLLKINTNIGN
ncbi:hypothetical protein [Pasteurella phage PHB01]|uniref:Uncharacterized protein n=1 Tax=Pasteurella phage PHB01 TaxID=2006930 RepID=A0A218M4D9_9CAUD|nr:hypothetical protein HOR83_gp03 [Pasteurella phage PHB01]ASD51017.1 hypothetical protein [Pasteurella phage PHB01]